MALTAHRVSSGRCCPPGMRPDEFCTVPLRDRRARLYWPLPVVKLASRWLIGIVLAMLTMNFVTVGGAGAKNVVPAEPSAATPTEDTFTREMLSGWRLTGFLGPVSPDLFTWIESWEPGKIMYDGIARPPLSGNVLITICLGPDEYSHMPRPGGSDSVGVLKGSWNEWTSDEGTRVAWFGFADADNNWLTISINSPSEADAAAMAAEVARLPMFNSSPRTPFEPLLVIRRIARLSSLLSSPFTFLVTVWLADCRVRRRSGGWSRRALAWAVISAFWIAGIALLGLTPAAQSSVADWVWGYTGPGYRPWVLGVPIAVFGFGLCVAAGLLIWHSVSWRKSGSEYR